MSDQAQPRAKSFFISFLMVTVLGIILISHLLDRLPGQIWIPDVAIGGLLVLGGLFMWSKRQAPAS